MSLVIGFGALALAVETSGPPSFFWFGVAVGAFICSGLPRRPPPAE